MDNHLKDQINYYLRKVKPTLEQVMELFEEILTRKILKKAVFSKPEDRATVKTVVTPYKRPDGAPPCAPRDTRATTRLSETTFPTIPRKLSRRWRITSSGR